jgi:hypothetical protein
MNESFFPEKIHIFLPSSKLSFTFLSQLYCSTTSVEDDRVLGRQAIYLSVEIQLGVSHICCSSGLSSLQLKQQGSIHVTKTMPVLHEASSLKTFFLSHAY